MRTAQRVTYCGVALELLEEEILRAGLEPSWVFSDDDSNYDAVVAHVSRPDDAAEIGPFAHVLIECSHGLEVGYRCFFRSDAIDSDKDKIRAAVAAAEQVTNR